MANANVPFSGLPVATTLTGAEVFPLDQGGTTKQATIASVATLVSSVINSVGNPTALVGLTAVNGSTITAMRRDGAPALDQSIAPTWTGGHTFKPVSGDAIVILPASNSSARGFNITQNGPVTGGSGNAQSFNTITVNSDGSALSGASDLSGGFGLSVAYQFGSSNMQGSRAGIMGLVVQSSPSDPGAGNLTRDRIGVMGWAQANTGDGGTILSSGLGAFFGLSATTLITSGANNIFCAVGIESDAIIQSGGTARFRWAYSAPSNGSVQGSCGTVPGADSAFMIYRSGSVSWNQGITFGNPVGGGQPIDSSGIFIGTDGTALTGQTGIDFTSVTLTSNFINGPGGTFSVGAFGSVTSKGPNGVNIVSTSIVPAGYKVNGNSVLTVAATTYTQLNDPTGASKFFFGSSIDNTAYFRNATILFQPTSGSSYSALSVTAGGIQFTDNVNIATIAPTVVTIAATLPVPAGGLNTAGYKLSGTANFGIFFGSGAPLITAAQGSLYLRSDGASSVSRAYINTAGTSVWTTVLTAI